MNPDIAGSGFNPLVHYVLRGRKEGRFALPPEAAARLGEENVPFGGSRFDHLSISGLSQVVEYLAESATTLEDAARVEDAACSPLISIIMPVFNTEPRFLYEAVQSVRAQTYHRWELCIVDDCSTSEQTIRAIRAVEREPNVKVKRLGQNSGIAQASHAALHLAAGEYVAFLDHDDMLTSNALSEIVRVLRQDPELDFIYSDHVMVDTNGLPRFIARKPSWSPEFLLSTNYIVHFKVMRRSIMVELGGIEEYDSNVQDLGVSLRLLEAKARVKHLPKAVYLWREHKRSVAMSTDAKPGIEGQLVRAYDKHFARADKAVEQQWPKRFRPNRQGVFKLAFGDPTEPTALVAVLQPDDTDEAGARARLRSLVRDGVELHVHQMSHVTGRGGRARADGDEELRCWFSRLEAETVVVVNGTARCLSPTGLRELTGYLHLDDAIGAAGGRILDDYLRVRAGGLLLGGDAEYRLICGGYFDNEQGHWFTGQVSSNVDALSSLCIAVRKTTLVEGPGLKLYEFGDLAAVALCQDLRRSGLRIVHNPAFKMHDRSTIKPPASALDKIGRRAQPLLPERVYEEF